MIGVVTHSRDQAAAREFFELFKTPWEFVRDDRHYAVVIATDGDAPEIPAALTVRYGSQETPFDRSSAIRMVAQQEKTVLSWRGACIPIYGNSGVFAATGGLPLEHASGGRPAGWRAHSATTHSARIGYDLFQEIRHLLTLGQPQINAAIPTLELHIALLRELVTCSGIPLVEIPPVPRGFSFMSCLTHDVDHPVLRNHCLDHTMFGFLYRATVGSLLQVCRGRKPLKTLHLNWAAACALPFVYAGVARDFWRGFDRYLDLESGLGATYFVITEKNNPGVRSPDGTPRAKRASRYDLDDIKPELARILAAGCEVGVHGIDAWVDGAKGRDERERLRRATGSAESGVRMHWLYSDDHSPRLLEDAGFSYDSTFGYNHTVGYRAGTSQVFKPLNASRLLELPLVAMDTALFYPGCLNLTDREARDSLWNLLDDGARYGGCLTVNWHDRSIVPERLWDDVYIELLKELKHRRAWFPTASEAVSWFRMRREVTFDIVEWKGDGIHVGASTPVSARGLPGLRLRIHPPTASDPGGEACRKGKPEFTEFGFMENIDTRVAL